MTERTNKYLDEVARGLSKLPESERNEILNEIRNHIYEALQRQEIEEKVLDRLGSPTQLAQSYTTISDLDNGHFAVKDVWGNMGFYFSTGLSGVVIVPTLLLIMVGFVLFAIGAVGYSIAGIFMNLPGVITFGNITFSGIAQFVVSIPSCIVLLMGAHFSWKQLRKYISKIANSYQHKRLNRIR